MQWQAIRQHYPHQWLLLEALKAHREGGKRILDQLAVLETYTDSITALQAYKILHGQASVALMKRSGIRETITRKPGFHFVPSGLLYNPP